MRGSAWMLGRESTRQVMLTICRSVRRRQRARTGRTAESRVNAPFVPVREAMLRGLARMSYTMGVSNHGILERRFSRACS